MLRNRLAIVIAIASASGASSILASCSTSSKSGFEEPDSGGGTDATVEAAGEDATKPDAGGTDGPPVDDAGGPKVEGGCSPVNTQCDRVLQNCGAGQQCVEMVLADGGYGTQCVSTSSSQRLPKGHSCCPNQEKGPDPCGQGLECIGLPDDPCAADASLTGRCTPACCADDICGKSDPEGFAGRCTLNIVTQSRDVLYKVCEYNQICKPFHVQQTCPQGFTCILEDKFGTASCVPIFNPTDGGGTSVGLGEGALCDSLNSCADGLLCIGPAGGNSTCQWLCLTPNSNPPFDAGALRDGAAGYGGCPAGESCVQPLDTTQFPVWISACK
jgi:hypothetical protein